MRLSVSGWTVSDLASLARSHLSKESPDIVSFILPHLLHYSTGLSRERLLTEHSSPVDEVAFYRLEDFLERYFSGESIWNILGWREFWGRRFEISRRILEPRSDTETLIEWALEIEALSSTPVRILDLGVGSGCLLLSLLCEWDLSFGLGCDISPDALIIANNNARLHGVWDRARFLCVDWRDLDHLRVGGDDYDLILCNPPYIGGFDYSSLPHSVLDYDPALALYGGSDGLDGFRSAIHSASHLLKRGGYLLLEIGAGQFSDVKRLLMAHNFCTIRSRRDISGVIRSICAQF